MRDYEQMLEDFYRRLVQPGDVCIDVGAHTGRHTLPLSECVGKDGRVYAFEPLPAIAAQLRESLRQAGTLSSIVELTECALAEETGIIDFVLVNEAPGYSGIRRRHYDSEVTTKIIKVPVRRLDDMAQKFHNLRFMKIDCEGAELHVLRGAKNILQKYKPVVSFECGAASLESYDYGASDIYDFLNSLGYRIQSINQVDMDRSGFTVATERQEFWDYIATPVSAKL